MEAVGCECFITMYFGKKLNDFKIMTLKIIGSQSLGNQLPINLLWH